MDLILSHVGADFDALASMVAARKLYPDSVMAFTGTPEPSVREFVTLHRAHFPVESASKVLDEPLRRLILVDTRNPSRLGPFRQRINEPGLEVHIYDHHPPSAEAIRGDCERIETVGAAVTVLLKEVRERGLEVTPLEATLFLIGIYEETGSLTFPGTTAEDLRTAAWLLECGANLTLVPRFVRQSLTSEQRELLDDLFHGAQLLSIRGFQVLVASTSREDYVPGLAILAHRLLDLEEADAALLATRMRDRIYLVGRSREHCLDVGRLLAEFGGGGHATAASASLNDGDLEAIRRRMIELVEASLPSNLTAADLMTRNVQCLDIDDEPSVEEAGVALRRLGHTAVCVRKAGRIVGMIARSDVDKALAHDLGHAPASAYMSSGLVSVTPDTSIDDIQAVLVERDIGRVPVMEGERLVGLVSRTDILAALYSRGRSAGRNGNTVPAQLLRLPEEQLAVLRLCGDVADQLELEAYVVGGFVRDLLLGVPNQDLDLVVEGDGVTFGQKLSERMNGRPHPHERFGTCVVAFDAGPFPRIDVATARSERYCRPAALPAVEGSTLKQDLFRRDFTINCLALRLGREHFGELLDYFGSQRDLEAGLIRVLHVHSFIDDPTRILRALRFEGRLRFRVEQHTEHLLRSALSQDIFAEVTPERIRDEFESTLAEPRVIQILQRMKELKVLRCIHPSLSLDGKVTQRLRRVPEVLAEFGGFFHDEPIELWRLNLLCLASELSDQEVSELRQRYRLAPLPWGAPESPAQLVRRLHRRELSPSRLYRSLERLGPEALLFLAVLSTSKMVWRRLRLYLTELREVEPLVTGRHLVEWGFEPGPEIGETLTRLFDEQLDGRLTSLDQARASAVAGGS